ncbi:hypothetical protein CMI37_07095 [Candidatus Pacearchaeota archaeon]|nr:hypothetical protein [Candidatus Pacearchaeota archaeon]|tara:strand:- start:1109 stop:3265 length:2157 start_codon:yes stop_codon:yes gene_type:complete
MAEGMNLKLGIKGANKVQRELKQTGKAAGTMGRGMQGATSSAAGLGAMIGPQGLLVLGAAAVTGGFLVAAKAAETLSRAYVGAIKKTFELSEQLDTIGKKARSLNADPEQFQALIGSFELAGVESSKAMKALQKLSQSMGEAMKGTKSYTDAFDAMGLSAETLARTPLTERMLLISQGMANMGTQAERSAHGSLVFGRAFKDMVVAFEDGRPGLQAGIDDIERFGIATNESVRNSEELQDAVLRMNKAVLGLKMEALTPLLGTLTGVTNALAKLMVEMDADTVEEFGTDLATFTAAAAVELLRLGAAAETFVIMFEPAIKAAGATAALSMGQVKLGVKLAASSLMDLKDTGEELAAAEERWAKRITVAENEIAEARRKAGLAVSIPTAAGAATGGDFRSDLTGGGTGTGTGGGGGGGGGGGPAASAASAQVSADAAALQAFRDSLETRQQLELAAHLERVALIGRTVEDQIEAYALEGQSYQQYLDTVQEMQARHDEDLQRLREENAAKRKADAQLALEEDRALQNERAALAQASIGAVAGFAELANAVVTSTYGEGTAQQKKAAKAGFVVAQASALASSIVSTAAAIANANATLPYLPLGPIMAAAAAVTGGAQIAAIAATTIKGVGDAGIPPGALRAAGLNKHTTIALRDDEMVLDPVGTRAISEMLQQRSGGDPITVNTVLEIDGQVLGQTVDQHLIRSSERGLAYSNRERYGGA